MSIRLMIPFSIDSENSQKELDRLTIIEQMSWIKHEVKHD